MYGPNEVNVTVGSGAKVSIATTTEYPFQSLVSFAVTILGDQSKSHSNPHGGANDNTDATAEFPLLLRIPTWCNISRMEVKINGGARLTSLQADPHLPSFVRIERTWSSGDVLSLNLGMDIIAKRAATVNSGWTSNEGPDEGGVGGNDSRGIVAKATPPSSKITPDLEHGHQHMLKGGHMNNTGDLPFCTVERGPLLFVLPLEPNGGSSIFNYAVDCDAASMVIEGTPGIVPGGPFNWPLKDAPVKIGVKAARFDWSDVGLLPNASVSTANQREVLSLVPYGCTQVYRLSMFPFLDKE
jgi:hypothetical protein